MQNHKTYNALKVFQEDTPEYDNLYALACDTAAHAKFIDYKVETTYFDVGQNWLYTTVIAYDLRNNRSWQALTPKDQFIAVFGSDEDRWALRDKLIAKYEKD